MIRPLQLAHKFLKAVVTKQDQVVDATMGNGHDTLFLATLAKKVFAFDIQTEALLSTQNRIQQAGFQNVELIQAGHEKMDQYVDSAKAVIFNLGYLPCGDKSIITKPETTRLAIKKACQLLEIGGRMAIMVYQGHAGALDEKKAVEEYITGLSQSEFSVSRYQMVNQINCPPYLVMIEKK